MNVIAMTSNFNLYWTSGNFTVIRGSGFFVKSNVETGNMANGCHLVCSCPTVGDDFLFSSAHQLDSSLTAIPRKPLGPDASHHSSMSSGLGERTQPSKVHGEAPSDNH